MGLLDSKPKQVRYFALTGLDKTIVFIKTDEYESARALIIDAAEDGICLRRVVNDDQTEPNPIAYASKFFISAQETTLETASPRHNKLWEIV